MKNDEKGKIEACPVGHRYYTFLNVNIPMEIWSLYTNVWKGKITR